MAPKKDQVIVALAGLLIVSVFLREITSSAGASGTASGTAALSVSVLTEGAVLQALSNLPAPDQNNSTATVGGPCIVTSSDSSSQGTIFASPLSTILPAQTTFTIQNLGSTDVSFSITKTGVEYHQVTVPAFSSRVEYLPSPNGNGVLAINYTGQGNGTNLKFAWMLFQR